MSKEKKPYYGPTGNYESFLGGVAVTAGLICSILAEDALLSEGFSMDNIHTNERAEGLYRAKFFSQVLIGVGVVMLLFGLRNRLKTKAEIHRLRKEK